MLCGGSVGKTRPGLAVGASPLFRNLIKVLRAGYVILQDTTDGDMDEPLVLTKSIPKVSAVSHK